MRILVAEDDASFSRMTVIMGEAVLPGTEFVMAENGEQAMSLYEKYGDLDGVITDYQMPKADGVELASYLRRAGGSYLPIVLLSGTRREDIPQPELFDGIFDKSQPTAALQKLKTLIEERRCALSG